MEYMIDDRKDYNGVGVGAGILRDEQHIPGKNWPKFLPPPPQVNPLLSLIDIACFDHSKLKQRL